MKITVNFLLRGAFYALEQAGQLFQDAKTLYDRGRWASSFALAVLCREEIGRARICLEKRKLVRGGEIVTIRSLKAELSRGGAHERKVAAAQQIIGVPVSVGFWGEPPQPGSAEEKQLFDRLQEKRRILEKRMPKEAQERKERALYVDPAEDGSYWLRPVEEITQSEAELVVERAELEYLIQCRKLLNPADDPELKAAVDAWESKPSLPDFSVD